jgi:pantoate--beta-alanine ligase
MGFLHEGHLALLKEGRRLGDDLILSIFVNPTQFAPGEDYESYPRNFEKDFELARKEGVDVVFTPTREELYGDRFQTYVALESLPKHLCGLSRPSHFKGVATVVAKLFNIVKPHIAVFGQKDFQQLAIIRQMVRDLNFDIEIRGVQTIREKDGLAMSSRNAYLTPGQRKTALCLYSSLVRSRERIQEGEKDASTLIREMTAYINSRFKTGIDYISICDPDTLDDVDKIEGPILIALAVKVGKTRLIDNIIISP